MIIKRTWAEIKELLKQGLQLQYSKSTDCYDLFVEAGHIIVFSSFICKGEVDSPERADYDEFEANYKPNANKYIRPMTEDGKELVQSTSRPNGAKTYFTCSGDDIANSKRGEGVDFCWEFGNANKGVDDQNPPTGYLIKTVEAEFLDKVWIKDGLLFYFNASMDSHIKMEVICPQGVTLYYDENGDPVAATSETSLNRFANKNFMQDSVPHGVPYNTESCSDPILPGWKMRFTITEKAGSTANGWVRMEFYRENTV